MTTATALPLAKVIDLLLDAVCVVDEAGRFVFVSAAGEQIFGYRPDEMIGQPMISFVFDDDRERTLQAAANIVAGGQHSHFENRYIRKDGSVVHLMWSARWSAGDRMRIAVARDITARKQAEARIEHLALHDQLTDLPNRALFYDVLSAALNRPRRADARVAVLYIDLDGFKQVNDCYGHDVGDALLCDVAVRLRGCVRRSDLVARLGGDELVVVLDSVDWPSGVQQAAEKIRTTLAEPVEIGGRPLTATSSIGIALYPDHADNAEQLVRHADQAMYRAKNAGGNRVALAGRIDEQPVERAFESSPAMSTID